MFLPPRGHYLAREVGQLAGVSGETVGQWARYGYIRASQSNPGEYPQVYSFQDVAEAIVVHELIDQKIPLKVLRPFIEALRERLGDWPLQHVNLETQRGVKRAPTAEDDDETVEVAALLWRHGEDRYELGPHGWQQVEGKSISPQRVVADLTHGGWAVRRLRNLKHIEVNPDRLSGRPTIRGKRIAAEEVAELATIGPAGVEDLIEGYNLKRAEIDDAKRWWREVQRLAA